MRHPMPQTRALFPSLSACTPLQALRITKQFASDCRRLCERILLFGASLSHPTIFTLLPLSLFLIHFLLFFFTLNTPPGRLTRARVMRQSWERREEGSN